MKKRILSVILIMILMLGACGKAPEEKPKVDHKIVVSEDTYVLNKDGNGVDTSSFNYNNSTILHLKTTNGGLERFIYFKFDVSELKNDNEFQSISLGFTIYQKQNGSKQPVTISLYGCTSNWNGKDITYNNRPTQFSLISTRTDITAYNTEYSFPVTDYIKNRLKNGETTIAIMLKEETQEPKQIQIYSKEHSEEFAPNLFVSYSKTDNIKYTPHELEFLPQGLDKIVGDIDIANYKINAIEDTYVSGGDDKLGDVSGTNFGNSSILDLKAKGGKKYYRAVLLKFDLSNYKNKAFERAVLQLESISSESSDGTDVNIFTCSPTSWNENEVTYNTKPEKGELIGTFKSIARGIAVADITDYIKQCIANNINVISFYLEGTENVRLQFNSNESYENSPKIILYKQSYCYGTTLEYTSINPWSYAMKMVNDWIERWKTIQASVGTNYSDTITKIDSEYSNIVEVSSNANGDDTVYSNRETRLLETLENYTYNNNEANMYDEYGGYTGGIKYTATGYYRVQFNNGRWWIIDPLGYPFFSSGVCTFNSGSANQKALVTEKYGSIENWTQSATDRLFELGFNSASCSPSTIASVDNPTSITTGLGVLSSYGRQVGLNNSVSGSTTFVGGVMPVFDPMFVEYSNSKVYSQIKNHINNPYIIGWTSDNELHADKSMLDSYLNCDPSKQENVYSYATAWTFMYVMTGKTNITFDDITDQHRALFKAMVYDRYYNVVSNSIRMYDQNHMFVGSRYLTENFKDEYVMKVTGYYCDIITVNYYGAWTPDAELIANVQKWTNTPFLVTEAYAKGMDVCTPESGLTNKSGAGFTCKTQLDRAKFYQNYTLQLLECKYCVGYNWFRYWDNDPNDPTADQSNLNANKGIYNNNHEEYTTLTTYMQQLNLNKYSLIKYFDER